MPFIVSILILLVALEHLWFAVLEIFLWQKPAGLKAFKMTPEAAGHTALLAKNQGLYNGFLAAGLLWSLLAQEALSHQLKFFFLLCVLMAGLFGAATVSRRIFFIQALPALIALILAGLG